eukprot:5661382-Alexandrium_andersonii.AAC.1
MHGEPPNTRGPAAACASQKPCGVAPSTSGRGRRWAPTRANAWACCAELQGLRGPELSASPKLLAAEER